MTEPLVQQWMVDYEHAEGEPQHAVLSWLSSDPTRSLPPVGTVLVRLDDYVRVRDSAVRFAQERDAALARLNQLEAPNES